MCLCESVFGEKKSTRVKARPSLALTGTYLDLTLSHQLARSGVYVYASESDVYTLTHLSEKGASSPSGRRAVCKHANTGKHRAQRERERSSKISMVMMMTITKRGR